MAGSNATGLDSMKKIDVIDYENRGESSELITLTHAYISSSAKLHSVRAVIANEFQNAGLYILDFRAGWSSTEDPVQATQKLLRDI